MTEQEKAFAPAADVAGTMAELERLVEVYGDMVEQLGRDMEAGWANSRPTDESHKELLNAIHAALKARDRGPVGVPDELRVLAEVANVPSGAEDEIVVCHREDGAKVVGWCFSDVRKARVQLRALVKLADLAAAPAPSPPPADKAAQTSTQILSEDDVRGFLRQRPHGWNRDNGVNRSHLSEFMAGKRSPSTDVLSALGLEYAIVRKDQSATQTPAEGVARSGDAEVRGWQPIETAPRGRDILVFCSDTRQQFAAFWTEVGWQYACAREGYSIVCTPTHWRPLPTPPDPAGPSAAEGRADPKENRDDA